MKKARSNNKIGGLKESKTLSKGSQSKSNLNKDLTMTLSHEIAN